MEKGTVKFVEKLTAKNGKQFYKINFNGHLGETGLMFTDEEIKLNDSISYTRAQNESTRAITYTLIKKENKTFSGLVIGVKLVDIDAFGMRTYELMFRRGSALYTTSGKQTFNITIGCIISFDGEFRNNIFVIRNIFDVTSTSSIQTISLDLPKGNGFTEQEKKMIMTDAQSEEIMRVYSVAV